MSLTPVINRGTKIWLRYRLAQILETVCSKLRDEVEAKSFSLIKF
ncbi:hypothetical protein CAMRE0001_1793 [Campylobacter rectus RM3267]|uniref:Uncharacterized protein n=1 Tax=Campylobacter rectus RM3267 TaxID=553218 RepID=B9CYH3_CAMRE|nr:hypothetical protein CAMRE0001_1793 [Campylobacter rectus RM3267]